LDAPQADGFPPEPQEEPHADFLLAPQADGFPPEPQEEAHAEDAFFLFHPMRDERAIIDLRLFFFGIRKFLIINDYNSAEKNFKYALFCKRRLNLKKSSAIFSRKSGGKMKAKSEVAAECPVATTVNLIGNKWKLLVIRNLILRPWRFNELQRNLSGISSKVLAECLRSMEKDGIVLRKDYGEIPQKVEYSLSELGEKMKPILKQMEIFGEEYKKSLLNEKKCGG
jgi:DNA-binding HxlR family transcriptional regulator